MNRIVNREKRLESPGQELPRFVVLRKGQWYVRRNFPTNQRDSKNRIIYLPIERRCDPETPEAAEQLAIAIEQAFEAELIQKAKPQTVDDFFDAFLAAKHGSVEIRTFEYYESLFERHIKGTAFGSLVLADVRLLDDVQPLYRRMKETGASADAVRRLHGFLSIAFTQAVTWGVLPKNPVKGALIPKSETDEITFFDQHEARRFVAACSGDRHIVLHFALETGMRPGEYLGLRWQDVDIERGLVTVRQVVTVGLKGGGFVIKRPKTAGSRRTVAISEVLLDRLRRQQQIVSEALAAARTRHAEPLLLEHMKVRGANYQKRRVRRRIAAEAIANFEKYDLVFPAGNGAPVSRLNLNKRELREVLELAGIKGGHSLYSLRHTLITLLLAAGTDVKTIAERCGTSPEMIWKTYGHVLPSMRQDAMDNLNAALY